MLFYCGIDLGARKTHVCLIDENDRMFQKYFVSVKISLFINSLIVIRNKEI
jgi:hypothetical protein